MSVQLPMSAGPRPYVPAPGQVDFRLLGPVEAVVDGKTVALGGVKPRALLALLVLHPNEVVSRDVLIDGLWGEHAPPSADHALVVYVSRLRKALHAHTADDTLQREGAGYVLRVEDEQTDVWRFEHALEDGRRALAEGLPREAAAILRSGLGEWRGDALGDLAFEPFADTEAQRLEELRLTALEVRIDADLALGRHAELVGELESLVEKHPLNERLRGQLMLALYRSGRQVGALDVYRSTRRFLVDELGIEPGTDLQRLEQAILRHDPELEAPEPASSHDAAPDPEGAPHPQRKTVSVLFAALTAPATLRAELDPESLDAAVGRRMTSMKEAIERHGGTIERFVGETVLGIFGVPAVHEDDALRAVRAASDIRDAAESLNETLARRDETALELRVGVATGRVLAGGDRLVTGDAVNHAAELCRGAGAGQILVADETLLLVAHAVVVEPREPGDAPNVRRLVSVARGAGAVHRRLDVPLVGRARQLALLRQVFGDVVAGRSCHLMTISGAAGVGKTRLAAELAASLPEATVVTGRCVTYGDGVTYQPLAEVLRQLPDVADALPTDEVSREVIGAILGEAQAVTSTAEIERAVRKTLEAAARRRPLLVVLDDVQWGEAPFLDLVEHVAELSRDAPLLLVCLARSDLFERRPGWAGGKPNATTLRLEPLSPDETDELIRRLVGETAVEPVVLERVREAAAGNPLFVESLLALVLESDMEEPTVPPTIEAVLAARLDQLLPGERDVLEAGSVEGAVFHAGAVRALLAHDDVATRLDALVRKDLVRPGDPDVRGDDAFRFPHLLLRDATYAAVPKARRAELHERFADWIEEHGTGTGDDAAIDGHHLEQACRYRLELDPDDERAVELAARAGDRLTVAGRRAHALGDIAATVNLLTRAHSLLPAGEHDVALELADALAWAGQLAEAAALLDEAAASAAVRHDRSTELLARIVQTEIAWFTDPEGEAPELLALAKEAIPEFEASSNERGLMHAWVALAEHEHMSCRFAARNDALEQALVHARRAGDSRFAADIQTRIGVGHAYGPTPVDEGLQWLASRSRLLRRRPLLIAARAVLEAMRGHFRRARALLAQADALHEQLGDAGIAALQAEGAWLVEMQAGDAAAAERASRRGCRLLEEMGACGFLSGQAAELALALCALGRFDEAAEWARKSRRLAADDDVFVHVLWRQALAKVAADRGDLAEADTLARDAVVLAEQTDMLAATGDALLSLAGILRRAGRAREAADSAGRALALYERKGNTVMARRARLLHEADPLSEPVSARLRRARHGLRRT